MADDALPDRAHRHWYKPERYIDLVRILGIAVEICVLLAVTVIALCFQIEDRPKVPKIYDTNNSTNTVRKGETYACGCSLPATIQSPDNPSENTSSRINRCYEASELETVQVLMFPTGTTQATLMPVLDAFEPLIYYKNLSDGFFLGQQAHDLSGRVVKDPLLDDIKTLFLNEKRQVDNLLSISYLQGNEFMSFPRSFLRLAFSYRCTDCTTCAIEKVNDIFRDVSRDERWASCFYREEGDKCGTDNSYQAKCLLYPTKSLPPNFAIKGFFKQLLNLSGINEKDIHNMSPTPSERENSTTSLQPSSLYLNISQIENRSISMGFVEVVRGSAFWISVLNLFPAMDTSCSNMPKVSVCNGTSVCNVFTTDKSTKNYELRCIDLVDRDNCTRLMANSYADNVGDLGEVTHWDNINCGLANRTPQCFNITPNFVEWNISHRMAHRMDAVNEFLYDYILQDEWAQRTGVCTNTFRNVIRYPPKNTQDDSASGRRASGNMLGGDFQDSDTIYLESNCASSAFGRDPGPDSCSNCTSAASRRDYCWLTGRYNNLDDGPDKDGLLQWNDLHEHPLFVDSSPAFACYRVEKQSIVTWLIVTFGVVFGWIGTVHLIFKFSWWVIQKVARRVDGHTCCLQMRIFRPLSDTCSTLGSGSQSDLWSDSSQARSPLGLPVFMRSSSAVMRDTKSPHE